MERAPRSARRRCAAHFSSWSVVELREELLHQGLDAAPRPRGARPPGCTASRTASRPVKARLAAALLAPRSRRMPTSSGTARRRARWRRARAAASVATGTDTSSVASALGVPNSSSPRRGRTHTGMLQLGALHAQVLPWRASAPRRPRATAPRPTAAPQRDEARRAASRCPASPHPPRAPPTPPRQHLAGRRRQRAEGTRKPKRCAGRATRPTGAAGRGHGATGEQLRASEPSPGGTSWDMTAVDSWPAGCIVGPLPAAPASPTRPGSPPARRQGRAPRRERRRRRPRATAAEEAAAWEAWAGWRAWTHSPPRRGGGEAAGSTRRLVEAPLVDGDEGSSRVWPERPRRRTLPERSRSAPCPR